MAGNTKFLGFGADNEITLERWGKKATAKVPPAAVEALREMCFSMLPKSPPHQTPKFYAEYNYATGAVEVSLPPDRAKDLADILQSLADATGIVPETAGESAILNNLPDEIYLSLQEHEAFTSGKGEPGVE